MNDSPAGAPAVGAAPQVVPAAKPAGWEKIDDAAELARITEESGDAQTARAAAAPEPTALAVESVRNNKFVATEKTYAAPNTGALRACSDVCGGSWEGFTFEWIGEESTFAMKSQANGLYVAVEKNYTGASQNLLRARSASAAGWERFVLYYNEALDRFAIQSELNGLFVAMENSYTGTFQYALRARSTDVSGSWEEFNLYTI
ncbi:fascin domain-containing protein [Streptomyces pseudogriseolus]|uniref:fascin domain-containing protein n=1 Tax=Streptomyces pseudogriseolus TaxID=36817 RepID=UPI003FA29396